MEAIPLASKGLDASESVSAEMRNERATTQTNPFQADRRADGSFANGGMPPTDETTH
jgi:hypothetical protein